MGWRAARSVLVSALASFGFAPSLALADALPPPRASYSAELMITADGQSLRQVIYHDRGKERREMQFEGVSSALIVRPDQSCAYSIGDGPNTVMIDIAETGTTPFLPTMAQFQASREGEETIDGELVTRYAVQGPGADGEPVQGTVWVTADGIMMKSQMMVASDQAPTAVTVELAKIERKALPGSLFEPPPEKPIIDMRGEVEQARPMGSSPAE